MLRVGITGGIGSGKTTVCRIFSALGVPVYNSDKMAKSIMNSDSRVINDIISSFGQETYKDGLLDTKYLASRVFTDKSLLILLNGIVHPAVNDNFNQWALRAGSKGVNYVVQENAILFEGGFDKGLDYTVTVSAPVEQRIERAVKRDGLSVKQIKERMANQMLDCEREKLADYVLSNADSDLLLPQVLKLSDVLNEIAGRNE